MNDLIWINKAKGLLKAELRKKNITYEKLIIQLKAIGVDETVDNINNKINRGKFSAVFLIQCLTAMEIKKISLED